MRNLKLFVLASLFATILATTHAVFSQDAKTGKDSSGPSKTTHKHWKETPEGSPFPPSEVMITRDDLEISLLPKAYHSIDYRFPLASFRIKNIGKITRKLTDIQLISDLPEDTNGWLQIICKKWLIMHQVKQGKLIRNPDQVPLLEVLGTDQSVSFEIHMQLSGLKKYGCYDRIFSLQSIKIDEKDIELNIRPTNFIANNRSPLTDVPTEKQIWTWFGLNELTHDISGDRHHFSGMVNCFSDDAFVKGSLKENFRLSKYIVQNKLDRPLHIQQVDIIFAAGVVGKGGKYHLLINEKPVINLGDPVVVCAGTANCILAEPFEIMPGKNAEIVVVVSFENDTEATVTNCTTLNTLTFTERVNGHRFFSIPSLSGNCWHK